MRDRILIAINEIRQKGYQKYFSIVNGRIINKETKETLLRSDFKIDQVVRIDGAMELADTSILIAITCYNKNSTKGYFIKCLWYLC